MARRFSFVLEGKTASGRTFKGSDLLAIAKELQMEMNELPKRTINNLPINFGRDIGRKVKKIWQMNYNTIVPRISGPSILYARMKNRSLRRGDSFYLAPNGMQPAKYSSANKGFRTGNLYKGIGDKGSQVLVRFGDLEQLGGAELTPMARLSGAPMRGRVLNVITRFKPEAFDGSSNYQVPGSDRRRRWPVSRPEGGRTYPEIFFKKKNISMEEILRVDSVQAEALLGLIRPRFNVLVRDIVISRILKTFKRVS